MYFYPTVDYRSLVGVVISIPLSNKVIFLVCLYGFLSCSSSHLPLGSVSFKNNCIELWKIKRSVAVHMVRHAIPSLMGEGFSCDLLHAHAFCFPRKEIK